MLAEPGDKIQPGQLFPWSLSSHAVPMGEFNATEVGLGDYVLVAGISV